MNDLEKQLPTQFSQQKDQFQISLSIQGQSPATVLKIVLTHIETCEIYEKTINQEYIDGQAQMTNLIDDPQSLYTTLIKEFNQLNISENGVISFIINFGKKPKKIVIDTEKKLFDKLDMLNMQNQKLKKDFNTKIQFLSQLLFSEISLVKAESQKLRQQMIFQNEKMKRENDALREDFISKLASQNQELKQQSNKKNAKIREDFTAKIKKLLTEKTADYQKLKQEISLQNNQQNQQKQQLKYDFTAKISNMAAEYQKIRSNLTVELSNLTNQTQQMKINFTANFQNLTNQNQNLKIALTQQNNKLTKQFTAKIQLALSALKTKIIFEINQKIINLVNEDQKIKTVLRQVKRQLEIFYKMKRQFEQQMNHNFNFNPILKQHSGNDKFKISKQGRKCNVKHATESEDINFIGNFVIPSGQTTKFQVRAIQITNKHLGVGIGTKNMFGRTECCNKQMLCVPYWTNSVWEYEVSRDLDTLNLANGDVIEMFVDRSANVVTWLTNGNKIGQSPIAQHLHKKKLYLIIFCGYKNDEFEVSW